MVSKNNPLLLRRSSDEVKMRETERLDCKEEKYVNLQRRAQKPVHTPRGREEGLTSYCLFSARVAFHNKESLDLLG